MAKLFEEVMGGSNVSSSSADILIHFACTTEASKTAGTEGVSSPVPGCSTAGQPGCFGPPPRIGNEGSLYRENSPRSPGHINRLSLGSPTRILSPIRPTPVHDVEKVPGPLRCHSLVLQTQPTLLEKLLPGSNRPGRQNSGDEALSEAITDETTVASFSSEASPYHEGEGTVPEKISIESVANPQGGTGQDRMIEVVVDDEPDIFLEMIKFVYLNTCHVDQSNAKALMLVADKYNIEDIMRHCLQWMEEHFTANLFYLFLDIRLPTERSRQLLLQSLLCSLRSRRHFTLVTEDADGRWDQLPVSFMEALLSNNELPVVSEAEVLNLLARWASGVLARQEAEQVEGATFPSEDLDARETEAIVDGSNDSGGEGSNSSSAQCAAEARPREEAAPGAAATQAITEPTAAEQKQQQMLRLLRTFRKSEIKVRMSEIEPILQLLQLNSLFSAKPPRETAALDPGFMIYRGVAGVNVPVPFGGGLTQPDVVPHAWKSGAVTLNSHDFVQQQDGFRPCCVPGTGNTHADITIFPRLWTKIKCPSWSHLQKRIPSTTKGLVRHSVSGPVGGNFASRSEGDFSSRSSGDFSTCDTVTPSLMSMPLHEGGNTPMGPTLKTMQSQDDWEVGRTKHTRQTSVVPNISDNEKIEHKVIAAVLCGHVRHGIRICQRERSSIYYIEELDPQVSGQSDEVPIGGSPTEVEFELQLTAEAPDPCGICRCGLAVLPGGVSEPCQQDKLMEIVFKSSAEEPLHFTICSSHFDSNSSYSVELAWVLPKGPYEIVRHAGTR